MLFDRRLIALWLVAFAAFARADQPPQLLGARLDSPPKIDGDLSDEVWKKATHVSGFVNRYLNKPADDPTEVWLGYDRNNIYVAFYCHDSKPDQMVGREIQPGAEFRGEDTFEIDLNTFGNRNWNGISAFTVNLLNTQSERIAGGRSSKREWRGVWQSATRRVKDGWCGEMRIPWRILNYPPGGRHDMDLNFVRFQARGQTLTEWSNLTSAERIDFIGKWTGIEPPPVDQRRKWEFMAYAAGDVDSGVLGGRVGADIRYAPTPTTNALISLSPDFKNIENQIASNEFTRTERFIGETRPFFTEGGDFFGGGPEFSYGQMFYSQRIGQFDLGAKYFGRPKSDFAVGALVTERFGGETAVVAKATKNLTSQTYVSASSTFLDRPGDLGQSTSSFEFGSRRGNFGGDLGATIATTRGGKSDSAGSMAFSYSCPRWFTMVRSMWVQPDFDSALAYIPWTDRRGFYSYTEFNQQYHQGRWQRTNANLYMPSFKTYSGDVQERGYDFQFSLTDRLDTRYSFETNRTDYQNGRDDVKSLGVTFNNSNRFRQVGLYYENGYRADEPSSYVITGISWRLWRRLDIGLKRSVLEFQGRDAQTILTLGYTVNPTTTITGRYVEHNGLQNAYVAFRNAGGQGAEYYLILGDPNAAQTVSRVSFKVVWAF